MDRRHALKLIGAGVATTMGGGAIPVTADSSSHRKHTPRGPVTVKDPALLRGGETRPILNPRYIGGHAGQAYRAATEIPDVLDHLYCYCECETSVGHKSLKSCFTDLHGVHCGICQEQALMALRLHREGLSLLEIRQRVDAAFLPPGTGR